MCVTSLLLTCEMSNSYVCFYAFICLTVRFHYLFTMGLPSRLDCFEKQLRIIRQPHLHVFV